MQNKKVKKVTKNIGLIIAIVYFVILGTYNLTRHVRFYNEYSKIQGEYIEKCEGEYLNNTEYDELCDRVLEEGQINKYDVRYVFLDAIKPCGNYFVFLTPFVLVFAMLTDHKIKKLKRKEVCIKDFLKRSYKYSLLAPIYVISLFVASYIYSGGFVNDQVLNTTWYLNFISNQSHLFSTFKILMFFVLNGFLFSLFILGIAEIIFIKTKKFNLELLSFVCIYFTLVIFFELFLGILVSSLLRDDSIIFYFSLLNFWNLTSNYSFLIIRNLFLAILPLIGLFCLQNK